MQSKPSTALLASMTELVTASQAWTRPERLAAFATLSVMFHDIEAFLRNEERRDSQLLEELENVHAALRSAYEFESPVLTVADDFKLILATIGSIKSHVAELD